MAEKNDWRGSKKPFFLIKYVMTSKKWPIFTFFKKIVRQQCSKSLWLRAIIDSFEFYTINSFMKKKIKNNFIMFKTLFWVAQPKQKKLKLFFSRLCWNGHIPCVQILKHSMRYFFFFNLQIHLFSGGQTSCAP